MGDWIEINSEEDFPNEDLFCWWVNRTNGYMFPSKLTSLLGRSLVHKTFSHYMVIDNVPTAPIERKPLENQTSWTEFNVKDILNS